jgi:predicted Ser/Thr protein kinase
MTRGDDPDVRERWDRLKMIFDGALEQPEETRADWLARACGDDADLLAHAAKLLRSHDGAHDFLEGSASVDLADLLEQDPGFPAGAHDGAAGRAAGDARAGETPHWRAGDRVGHYVIVEELGRGGMGVVYLAQDERLGRRVALKALPPAITRRADLRERLRREARAASTISHHAVATVFALEEIDDHLLLVSEYVRGQTLRHVIDRGPVDAGLARTITASVAGALTAVHAAGVVHRDLKPENIVVLDDGRAKVVDFGIALVDTADRPRLTGDAQMLGTPAYMAPEQLLGLAVDARTDIYAFGVVLREMLLGQHPLAEGSRSRSTPTPMARSAEQAAFVAVADRCTHTAPDARYASSGELLADLDRAVASVVAPAERSRWWWEFHQGAVAIAYIAILVPVWRARADMGGLSGRAFFALATGAVIVAAFVRWHLWFTSRFYPRELAWVRARARPFVWAADWAFVSSLTAGAVLLADRSAFDVVLFACAVGAAVACLIIEPVTARAAFGQASPPSVADLPGL